MFIFFYFSDWMTAISNTVSVQQLHYFNNNNIIIITSNSISSSSSSISIISGPG